MTLDPTLRKEIIDFLKALPVLSTEKSRQALLLHAGLDQILSQTDLDGNINEVVILLVNALVQYGTLADNTQALVRLLQQIATDYVGIDKQQIIQEFCNRILEETQGSTPITPSNYTNQLGGRQIQDKIRIANIIWLRSEPQTVSKELFIQVFNLNENQQPIEYIQNQYEDLGSVVSDRATGLMWQKSGSDKSLTFKQAKSYIKQLNNMRYAGYEDWRMPTTVELMSLLEPEQQANVLYINPIFNAKQRICWSIDRVPEIDIALSGMAWRVDFFSGHVSATIFPKRNYIRGVRSYVFAILNAS